MNICICGIGGKMGGNVKSIIDDSEDITLVCGVDLHPDESALPPIYGSFNDIKESVDVVIDFSSPAVLSGELEWAIKTNTPLVLATTGYSKEQLQDIDKASEKVAIFKTANFSLGVNLLVKLVNQAAAVLGENFDIEIIEKHHNNKVDAPSGTAIMLADAANAAFDNQKKFMSGRDGIVGKRGNEIGLHAVRGGTIVGEHEVMFAGNDEIITLSHSARSKMVFAEGAVKAARFMVGKKSGKYDMTNVLENL